MSCRNQAYFFSFNDSLGSTMTAHGVKGTRILPCTRHLQLERFLDSKPLFLQGRNYKHFSHQSKGVVCYFFLYDTPEIWKLGVINKVINNKIIVMHMWNGLQTILENNDCYSSFLF